jgi:hypothetical protein
MSITIPKPPDLGDLRAERDALSAKIRAAQLRYERRVEKKLADVTVDHIERLDDVTTLLATPGRRAHDLVKEWVTTLGSSDMHYDGVLLDRDRNGVGPAVVIAVPNAARDDARVRKQNLLIALGQYENFLAPVVESLGADGIVVKILDNDLSESGIPELRLHTAGSCDLTMTVRGSTRTTQKWTTLAEAIEWLAKNRWYGEPVPERDEWGY